MFFEVYPNQYSRKTHTGIERKESTPDNAN